MLEGSSQNIRKETDRAMPLMEYILTYLDTLAGHLTLAAYLMAVMDEQAVLRRLKKLPPLLLSPLIATLTASILFTVPEFRIFPYFICSSLNLSMCTLWAMWAWRMDFWRAFSSVCMAGVLQVATSALAQSLFLLLPAGVAPDIAAMAAVLLFAIAAASVLRRRRFGVWFRVLLEDQSNLLRTAGLILAFEASMETMLILQNGVQEDYLAAYYILLVVLVIVISALTVHWARRFDDSRILQAQQDVIAQQQLYEQSLEDIRREVRSFRHDYKNLLAGLSQQVEEGRLHALRSTLAELDADFDRRLGETIQLSAQIGNLRVPQVRSLLLSKLAGMQEKGLTYRLEVLYPVEAVGINVWDFIRCLGILVDNAVEAALDTERPWVEIVLLVQDGRTYLRVSNPYTNTIDPGKIWDGGWSTKGPGRGVGLSSYQRIVESCPGASACTSWEGGVFVQELTVEDRP